MKQLYEVQILTRKGEKRRKGKKLISPVKP